MKKILIAILSISILSCSPPTLKVPNDSSAFINSVKKKNTNTIIKVHLHDTTVLSGNSIVFLRPDSSRFENYSKDKDSPIYEVDSDFGLGIANTMDSMKANIHYKNINPIVSITRFILIKDCKNSPLLIDRDSIDYGVILSTKGEEIKIIYTVHSGDYLGDIDDYFKLRN